LEIEPDYAGAYYNLAIFYFQEAKYDMALKHCNRAIELGYRVPPDFIERLRQ